MPGSWGVLCGGRAGTRLWPSDKDDIKMQAPRKLPGRGFSQTQRPGAAAGAERAAPALALGPVPPRQACGSGELTSSR